MKTVFSLLTLGIVGVVLLQKFRKATPCYDNYICGYKAPVHVHPSHNVAGYKAQIGYAIPFHNFGDHLSS